MNKRTKDIFIVGFALFGSYFGAGNLIFPPLIGFLSGSQWSIAALGFCISAVLMPVVGLYVISKNGGSLETMTWCLSNFDVSWNKCLEYLVTKVIRYFIDHV